MKNIGKIILIVLGLALIALAVKGIAEIPAMNAAMEAAVSLEQPVVLPENEGKLVIIHGHPEMTAPVCDPESGLTLPFMKAIRYTEEYRMTSKKDQTETYGWVAQASKTITGEAAMGDFVLDEKLVNAFPADQEFADFDAAQLSETGLSTDYGRTAQGARTDRLWAIAGGDYYYDTLEYSADTDIPLFVREANEEVIRERSGARAYAYRVFACDSDALWTVAGIQQGSSLVADETLGPVVRSGVVSKEELLKTSGNATLFGAIAFALLGAVCILLALRGLRRSKVETYTYYDKEQANK
jgi:hypothetical protein